MNKKQVRRLTDRDLKLQWWAAVLFAEISDLVECVKQRSSTSTEIYPLIEYKVEEFDKLVAQRMREILEEKDPIEERLRKLEERVFKDEV